MQECARPALPEERRGILRSLLFNGQNVRLMECHNGLSARIAESAQWLQGDGATKQFDGLWVSSLTETAARGYPDADILGLQTRISLVREVCSVSRKPIVVDVDTGGDISQFRDALLQLESLGVSAAIAEDKVYPKRNSLCLGQDQTQETPERFALKIAAGRRALRTADFLIGARIESFIAGAGLEDALARARLYEEAGADFLVIHSRSQRPDEVMSFMSRYFEPSFGPLPRRPLCCIPTTYNSMTDEALFKSGASMVIHANHLLRAAALAMTLAAQSILASDRSFETEPQCLSLKSLFENLGLTSL